MQSTIRVQPHLTYNQFGISERLFEEHIKGKELPVLSFEKGIYKVLVAGEEYNLFESDTDKAYHAICEEYDKHDNHLVEALKK